MSQPTDPRSPEALVLQAAYAAVFFGSLPPTDRPCPLWCALPSGHPWEGRLVGQLIATRYHVRNISEHEDSQAAASVSITAEEVTPIEDCGCGPWDGATCEHDYVPNGPSTVPDPVVSCEVADALDADQAVQLAAWLEDAALLVRRYSKG